MGIRPYEKQVELVKKRVVALELPFESVEADDYAVDINVDREKEAAFVGFDERFLLDVVVQVQNQVNHEDDVDDPAHDDLEDVQLETILDSDVRRNGNQSENHNVDLEVKSPIGNTKSGESSDESQDVPDVEQEYPVAQERDMGDPTQKRAHCDRLQKEEDGVDPPPVVFASDGQKHKKREEKKQKGSGDHFQKQKLDDFVNWLAHQSGIRAKGCH